MRRTEIIGNSTTVEKRSFVLGSLYADLDGTGVIGTRYLSGTAEGEVWGRRTGTTGRWLLQDRQQSVREVLAQAGTLDGTITYDAFGRITGESNPGVSGALGYTGLRRDDPGGLWWAHWRTYDAQVGQWLQEDPILFSAGDPNIRRYVGNDAANQVDPSGLEAVGHHYFPASIVKQFLDSLDDDALKIAAGFASGPTIDKYGNGHCYGEYGGVKHSKYNDMVTEEWSTFAKNNKITNNRKATADQMQRFIDSLRSGEGLSTKNKSSIVAFNTEVDKQAADYVKKYKTKPFGMSQADNLARGTRYLKNSWSRYVAKMVTGLLPLAKPAGVAIGALTVTEALGSDHFREKYREAILAAHRPDATPETIRLLIIGNADDSGDESIITMFTKEFPGKNLATHEAKQQAQRLFNEMIERMRRFEK